MFQQIRYRLVFSYLAVLTVILTTFAIAVRIVFTRSLDQQLMNRLETLAKAAALNLEIEDNGEVEVDDEQEELIAANQVIQWFDTEGNLIEEQGDYALMLPFDPDQAIQTQSSPLPAKSLMIPTNDYDTGKFVGYTRVSLSTQDLNNTLRSLDRGLGVGVVMALSLSGLGGIWLTRQAMQPIEESFERLKQFTADASHELRNPLMAIKSNAAVALKYPHGMRETDREKFSAIASATNQMTQLTEDLLLLARNDRSAKSDRTRVNLTVMLRELVALYEPLALDKKLPLKLKLTTI
ncbi:MAG: histidine kinase dimerization/phospho-acceptor domain-containing protein [Cyanophyceae cyanobacterium]